MNKEKIGELILRNVKSCCRRINVWDEDIQGDIVVKVLEKYERYFKGDYNSKDFYWWINRVCKNELYDIYTRKKIKNVVVDFDEIHNKENLNIFERAVLNQELKSILAKEQEDAEIERIDQLVNEMDSVKHKLTDRQLIVLKGRLSGLKIREIAEIEGVSVENIGVTYHRLKDRLRKDLDWVFN